MNKMKFKLHLDAVNYFKSMKKIPKDWKKMAYILPCLMVGLKINHCQIELWIKKLNFMKHFLKSFDHTNQKIIAKLIHSELLRKGRN